MKRYIGSATLAIVSTGIALGMAELIVRILIGAPLPEKLPLVRVNPDPDIGWVMKPLDKHYTYDRLVTLNSHGFRGPEIYAKSDNEYRILAIGDSHIYGQGIEDSALLTTILEDGLNESRASCRFKVINMGVRAYSINNEYALLEKVGLSIEPDHVLLFFYINDFEQMDIYGRFDRFREYDWYMFDLSDKPTKALVKNWKMLQFARKSALLMWSHDIYQAWQSRNNLVNRILQGNSDDQTRSRTESVLGFLDQFQKKSIEHGFRLTLVLIPPAVQIRTAYPDNLYQATISSYARNVGIDYLDLLPFFQSYYERQGILPTIPFDGHYNEVGQGLMAEATLQHLKNNHVICH